MAAGTTTNAVRAHHATLVAGNFDTVNFSQPGKTVLVENRDPANDIYVRFDGTAPVVGADDCYIVRANSAKIFTEQLLGTMAGVQLISVGAAPYSVEAHF